MLLAPQNTRTHVNSLVDIQICVHIPLVCSPDCTRHARPWLFKGQDALDIIAMNLVTRYWIDDGRFDAKEGEGG